MTFDTPFGKFGVFTCFDIFSYDPAVMVVKDSRVDSVLLPTAWYNTLPLLSAVPFHSAWARAMGVNVLAANTHNTRMHMTGNSGQSSIRWQGLGKELPIDFQAKLFLNGSMTNATPIKLITL